MLLQAESAGDGDCSRLTAAILRVFVDARSHVPRHRLAPLFSQLLAALRRDDGDDDDDGGGGGGDENLATLLVLLLEASVRTKDVPVLQDMLVGDEAVSRGQACIQMRVTAFKCKYKCAKRFKCKCKCKCTAF